MKGKSGFFHIRGPEGNTGAFSLLQIILSGRSQRSVIYALMPFIAAVAGSVLSAKAEIVINEIYYDHKGADSGYEFIELFNNSDNSYSLNGIELEFVDGRTGAATLFYRFESGDSIAGRGLLTVGGESVPVDFLADCSLQNGPDAVRIRNSAGVIDIVGYGQPCAGLIYETEPAADVKAGTSLSRNPDGFDSDNNRADFVAAEPSCGEINFCDKDIGISILSDNLPPCRGRNFNFRFVISNEGFNPYTGDIRLRMTSPENRSADIRLLSLLPGSFNTECIYLAIPASDDSMTVAAHIEGDSEGRRSNDSLSLSIFTSPGIIVVNEIMYRPEEYGSEWLELYNSTGSDVNLKGWSISDSKENFSIISEADLMLGPMSYMIIAQDSGDFREHTGEVGLQDVLVTGLEGGWPVLNDYPSGSEREIINICDCSGRLVERVWYRDLLWGERGRSIERYSVQACSGSIGDIWHRCAAPAGSTPGSENSVAGTATRSLEITPNPFVLPGDRSVTISGSVGEGLEGFLVRIYGMNGKEVATVIGERRGAEFYSCKWNGRDSDGTVVGTGLYICVAEYFSKGGVVMGREKACIAVSSGVR